MRALHALRPRPARAGSMTWEILWALILGFILAVGRPGAWCGAAPSSGSSVTTVPGPSPWPPGWGRRRRRAPTRRWRWPGPCSAKGASFTAAMVFEIASTNLVVELGIILALLLGWQFTLAEFVGGPVMIVFLALWFRLFLRGDDPRRGPGPGRQGRSPGSMEGHAAMDMSIQAPGSVWHRLRSRQALTADLAHLRHGMGRGGPRHRHRPARGRGPGGVGAGRRFWRHFFFAGHPAAVQGVGPLIGPVVSLLSFVCSIGNVPLAAVLWNGGISFGGVVAFIFADLIIVPILAIYRKYYGTRMMLVRAAAASTSPW